MKIDFEGPARAWQDAWSATADALVEATPTDVVILACNQGFVLTHEQARQAGCSNADIRRNVYRQIWSVPRRGVVSVLPPGDGSTPDGLCLEVRAAAAALVRPGSAISHGSAAAARGLPVFGGRDRPELTCASIPRTADRGGARVYAASLGDDVRTWFGAPILSPARTVLDLARHGRRAGLVAADAALHERLVARSQLWRAGKGAKGWPGIRKARAIVDFASELAESPLESITRLLFNDRGLPPPKLQQWIHTSRGWFRVDGVWPDRMVAFEADGLKKYRDEPDARAAEKVREEALWRAGFRIVRILWDDVLNHPAETVWRVRRDLELGGPGLLYRSA